MSRVTGKFFANLRFSIHFFWFFVKNNQIENDKITIIGTDVNHIANVLRLKINDQIKICNEETAQNYIAKITEINKEDVECKIIEKIASNTEATVHITIFQGLPKADKMELIIQKCTELGVKEITPVQMKRCVTKLDEKSSSKKIERWQKIAEVAAKQSQRDQILKVNNIINFDNIIEKMKEYDIVLIAYENEKDTNLKSVLKNIKKCKQIKIAIIIGPEGGIDESEIEKLKQYKTITLGKRILRTETAPIVMASNILYELEE